MLNSSTDLINVLKSGIFKVYYKIDLLDKNEGFIEELQTSIIDGNISVNKNNDIRRNFNLTIANPTNEFTPGIYNKIWLNKKFKIYIGLELPTGIEYIPQGVFNISRLSSSTGVNQIPQVRIEGMDKMSGWGKIVNNLTINTGINIGTAIRLVLDGIESKFNFNDCTDVTPYTLNYPIGTDIKQIVKELSNMITWDLGYNPYGELRFKPHIEPDNSIVSWEYIAGADITLYSGSEKEIDTSELYNHVLTIGASSQSATVSAEAKDDDLASPFSISNIGDRLFIYNNGSPDPLITTIPLAQARSDYELRKKLQTAEKQHINLGFPNFLHEEGDVVKIVDAGSQTNDKYELLNFSIPLMATSSMSGECWRVRRLV